MKKRYLTARERPFPSEDDRCDVILWVLGLQKQGNYPCREEKENPYTTIKELGAGGQGTVSLATLATGSSDQEFVIKKIKGKLLDTEKSRIISLIKFFKDEVGHQNVSRYVDLFQIKQNGEPNFFVVMEYIEGCDLYTYYSPKKRKDGQILKMYGCCKDDCKEKDLHGDLSKPDDIAYIHKYLGDILKGLKFLHSHNIFHRDVKPENIVISPNRGAVLIDIELSCIKRKEFDKDYTGCFLPGVGTRVYLSFPIIDAIFQNGFSKDADVSKILGGHDIWAAALSMIPLMISEGEDSELLDEYEDKLPRKIQNFMGLVREARSLGKRWVDANVVKGWKESVKDEFFEGIWRTDSWYLYPEDEESPLIKQVNRAITSMMNIENQPTAEQALQNLYE